MSETFGLSRFVTAHKSDYEIALKEIKNGKKMSHWMWYIFPQIHGLGMSYTSQHYAIQNLDEAAAFLADPYLGKNLVEICKALIELETNNPTEVFGKPDDMKLRSSMTLFACVSESPSVFDEVLDKYFGGKPDYRTKKILGL